MRNKRHLEAAVAKLREDKHLPDRVLDLSDHDIIATVQSVVNVVSEIATSTTESIELELEDADMLQAMIAAHNLNITFTEYVERALVAAIERRLENLDTP